jgi:hypothetical protein
MRRRLRRCAQRWSFSASVVRPKPTGRTSCSRGRATAGANRAPRQPLHLPLLRHRATIVSSRATHREGATTPAARKSGGLLTRPLGGLANARGRNLRPRRRPVRNRGVEWVR